MAHRPGQQSIVPRAHKTPAIESVIYDRDLKREGVWRVRIWTIGLWMVGPGWLQPAAAVPAPNCYGGAMGALASST
jgi:hypothetical protein